MADYYFIQNCINEAIKNNGDVKIKYRDFNGDITDRIITPMAWDNGDKFLAYCHLRKAERHFRINNILVISEGDSEKTEQIKLSKSETQNEEINTIEINLSKNQDPVQSTTPNLKTFTDINTADNWHSLLQYYIECLNYEYQQQFSFDKKALFEINIDQSNIYKFLTGQYQYNINSQTASKDLVDFINPSHKRNQQLCLGKSFIVFNDGKISPLLFTPITIKGNAQSNYQLQAEEVSISYAALSRLHYNPDEIADFLQSYEEFINSQPPFDEIEAFILDALKDKIPSDAAADNNQDFMPLAPSYKLHDRPGFFWVNNRLTGNLIVDLSWLKEHVVWSKKPLNIDCIFHYYPEHTHKPAPEFIEDKNFYVTDINTQQRKAVLAVSEHPVTIVTGPPGTGKSQLVLNLIAQAYYEGQSVLFASHNNQAVNVVMDRLQEEIRFQGAIRTGSMQYRRIAVTQMENALDDIKSVDIEHLERLYHQGKVDLKRADEELNKIRDIKGKIKSYQKEKEELLEKIPHGWREKISSIDLHYIVSDKVKINLFLTENLAKLRVLINTRQELSSQLQENFIDVGIEDPAFRVIHDYELKWGELSIGSIKKNSFSDLSELLGYCQNWERVFKAVSIKNELNAILNEAIGLRDQIDQNFSLMDDDHAETVLKLEDIVNSEFVDLQGEVENLSKELQSIENGSFSFLQKILIALHIINPKKKFIQHLLIEMGKAGINVTPLGGKNLSIDQIQGVFDSYQLVIQTANLYRSLQQLEEQAVSLDSKLEALFSKLPPDIQAEFDRINVDSYVHSPVITFLEDFRGEVSKAFKDFQIITQSFHSFFIENERNLTSIESLKAFDQQQDPVGLFNLIAYSNEEELFQWGTMLRRTLVIWEANSILKNSQGQLASLPTEEEASKRYKEANEKLFNLAGELMRANWQERASNVSNEVWEGTRKYISAVRQLNEINYGENPVLWRELKEAERNNFSAAFQMFPIWALTNLTARTNFPQTPGLFDLVIIDEASQCDIPSAIPLLYRAKKAVIIGDPNQLRHVASLHEKLDMQLGNKSGVGLEAFSYRSISLYDLSERSVGQKPGPILLNEHYRSDPRIINFSNKTFYKDRLDIKTDLTQRRFEKDYINTHGGISWLSIKGEYERPSGGSGRNRDELELIKQLLPKVLHSLDQAGYPRATVGIVTPFRAQENLINAWLKGSYPNSLRVRSGTAHQFQGDECDFMIFSSVLTDAIPEPTLNWLERTANLLNVAITRARVGLIIVGDFDFCFNNCKQNSKYHQLAAYVQNELDCVYTSIDELPLLGGEKVEIVGTLLDPSNSEYNRTNLIRFISNCREFVDWLDPYFTQEIIDLFDDLYEKEPFPRIKSFRLLTADRQVKVSSGKLRPESVESLQAYLKQFGVEFDVRVLPGEDLPHDRFLYHQGGAINMPPFSGAYGSHHHVSEYTTSKTNREMFEEYWERGVSVIDVY